MFTDTVKITSKGQLTIPKAIREFLNTETVSFEICNDAVIIKPVKTVAGSLKDFAFKQDISFKEEREQAWEEVINDRKK